MESLETKILLLGLVFSFFFLTGDITVRKNAKRLFLTNVFSLLGVFLLLILLLKYDTALAKLPLWIQKNSVLLLWLDLAGIIGLLNAYYLRRKRILFALLLDIVFLIPFWYYNEPIYTAIASEDISKSTTSQSTLYSCACASLSTIAKQRGMDVTEREACRLIGTTRYGSNPGEVRYAAKELGFEYKTLFGHVDIKRVHPPAILFTDRRGGYENHAVAYIKRVGRKYLLFDPMEGWKLLDRSEIERIWHGRGTELF